MKLIMIRILSTLLLLIKAHLRVISVVACIALILIVLLVVVKATVVILVVGLVLYNEINNWILSTYDTGFLPFLY
jgi:hypothetical protein